MNKKKVFLTIGAVLISVGTIGGAWSIADAVPRVIQRQKELDSEYAKKEVILDESLNFSEIRLNSVFTNIVVKKHDKNNILIERTGNKEMSNFAVDKNNGVLSVREELSSEDKSTSFTGDIIDRMLEHKDSMMIVYVPENMKCDISVNTEYGDLSLIDGLNVENINFNTDNGSINLEKVKGVDNLNITSKSTVRLSVENYYDIKNININSRYVEIYGEDFERGESNFYSGLTENLTINDTRDTTEEAYTIYIDSDLPIAKNVNIQSKNIVDLKLPIDDYNFNFDIKTRDGIRTDDLTYSENEIDNKSLNENSKTFKGILNTKTSTNSDKYNVNIESTLLNIK